MYLGLGGKIMKYYKAIDVLRSAKNTFQDCGDEEYAIKKANTFLRRCGAILEDGPEQSISAEMVKKVANAMFDAEAEESFFVALEW
jgi:hypothetical protein